MKYFKMAYEDLNTKYYNSTAETKVTVADLNSVKQGLERLLRTPKGHDPFNIEYGSSLYDLLFENLVHPDDISMFLYMDITTWEPRLELSPMDIDIVKIDNNTYKVTCQFVYKNIASGVSTTILREE